MPPRLNLDIFSEQRRQPSASSHSQEAATLQPPAAETSPEPVPNRDPCSPERIGMQSGSPRFIPVGFYTEHLRLLDEAVLRLRQQGLWKASKSGIIRTLIQLHAHELDEIWRSRQKDI